MKVIRGLPFILILGVCTAFSAAAQDFHARSGVGVTNGDRLSAFGANPADLLRGSTGTSALYEVGLGKEIPIPFFGVRTEVAFAYRPDFRLEGAGTVGGKPASTMVGLNQYTGMANLYLDAPVVRLFRPFLGAGIGAARNEADGSNTDFAWNIMAGFTVLLLPMTSLDLTLRHLDAGEVSGTLTYAGPSNGLNLHSQMRANEGVIGVRFYF